MVLLMTSNISNVYNTNNLGSKHNSTIICPSELKHYTLCGIMQKKLCEYKS